MHDERFEELLAKYIDQELSVEELEEWNQILTMTPELAEEAEQMRAISMCLQQQTDFLRKTLQNADELEAVIQRISARADRKNEDGSEDFIQSAQQYLQEIGDGDVETACSSLAEVLTWKHTKYDTYCDFIKSREQLHISEAERHKYDECLVQNAGQSRVLSYLAQTTEIPGDHVLQWLRQDSTHLYPFVKSDKRVILVAIIPSTICFPYDKAFKALWFNVNNHLHFICVSSLRTERERAHDIWHELNHMVEERFAYKPNPHPNDLF